MYSAPPIPGRGLGTGLLAGFFGWVVAVALCAGIGAFGLPYEMVILAFAIPVGLSAWIVRPTSWGVPVLYTLLSVPGYFIADFLRGAITIAGRTHGSVTAVLAALLRPDHLGDVLRVYVEDGTTLGLWGGALVLVFLLAMTAVLFGRSRAARAMSGGPRPGYPAPGPYSGPGPYGPGPGGAFPPPAGMAGPAPAYGPPSAYGPAARPGPGYGPPPGPPVPAGPPGPMPPREHAPPPPQTGPGPGGTRRLDPDEFDQMLYEQEQERRRARGE
ncbi:MAG TPA: hypothetical protein VGL93_20825 [Streptosporangiaceae bacterium]|jgi:hypothetical protein